MINLKKNYVEILIFELVPIYRPNPVYHSRHYNFCRYTESRYRIEKVLPQNLRLVDYNFCRIHAESRYRIEKVLQQKL